MRTARRSALLAAALALTTLAHTQMMAPPADAPAMQPAPADTPATPAPKPNPAAAQNLIARSKAAHVSDTPLNPTERAQQMLNRFTFGPRPGEVQSVLAMGGAQAWFEKQLQPGTISDSNLDKRIANDYPALALTPDKLIAQLPCRNNIYAVTKGTLPYPTDPIELGLYQVLVAKWQAVQAKKDAAGNTVADPVLTDEQQAQKKADGKATAMRIAGELFALPKSDRMAALMKMPVDDRIAFVTYVDGDQRRMLILDFSPHEREIFTGMTTNYNACGIVPGELQQAKMVRAVLSERQLQEVMTDFWFNHFNIFINKDSDEIYTSSYERDAIRPHALGKFRDLLLATAESPAMMVYLDNFTSIGPNSIANGGNNPNGKRGNKGLNENYAREVMELHTIGVNGGYTQADVTQLARILTGWSVDHPELGGGFLFNPKNHEPGAKQWLGETVPEDGQNEGLHALTKLANSPQCAHFISTMIAQRFVADDPPAALVARMQKTYLASDGDIKAVLRTLVQSPEFNSHRYFHNKVKTPIEFVASTFRSTATDPSPANTLVDTVRNMGMPLYQALPPTGYYITAEHWMNSAALIDRMNFALLLTHSGNGIKFDAPKLVTLELMAQPAPPAAQAGSKPKIVNASSATITAPAQATGTDLVVSTLENGLLNGNVSERTAAFLQQQAAQQKGSATDKLNQVTALVMGSPEFQMR
jgi:hypothetical protein